jgi:SAM-dependent methyltransferase
MPDIFQRKCIKTRQLLLEKLPLKRMPNGKVTLLGHTPSDRFTEVYLRLRAQEGWAYTDAALAQLPEGGFPAAQRRLWQWRWRSLARFCSYIQQKWPGGPAHLLDLGCGNGWMSAALARRFPASQVWAVDVNLPELEQGARVFANLPNVQFYCGDIFENHFLPNHFQCILLAGAIQYFPDLNALKNTLFSLLAPNGEIHVIDSNFYPHEPARLQARMATQGYYTRAGAPEMTHFYHHHLHTDWPSINLNQGLFTRLLQKTGYLSPFPWKRMRNDE